MKKAADATWRSLPANGIFTHAWGPCMWCAGNQTARDIVWNGNDVISDGVTSVVHLHGAVLHQSHSRHSVIVGHHPWQVFPWRRINATCCCIRWGNDLWSVSINDGGIVCEVGRLNLVMNDACSHQHDEITECCMRSTTIPVALLKQLPNKAKMLIIAVFWMTSGSQCHIWDSPAKTSKSSFVSFCRQWTIRDLRLTKCSYALFAAMKNKLLLQMATPREGYSPNLL